MKIISPVVIELVGVAASVTILISMLFKSTTVSGNLWMRIINNIGSVLFVAYGFMLNAWSTVALNIIMFFVNGYHIWKLHMKKKEELLKDNS